MVGVLTPEQQNRSRQITKLESDFGALNDSGNFAQTLFYNHQKVRRCSQNIQSTNTKFSKIHITSENHVPQGHPSRSIVVGYILVQTDPKSVGNFSLWPVPHPLTLDLTLKGHLVERDFLDAASHRGWVCFGTNRSQIGR